MHCASFACRGALTKAMCEDLSAEVVSLIDMTNVSHTTEEYRGYDVGVAHTRFLIESFVNIDSYHPFRDVFYLWVNSCKEFDPDKVEAFLKMQSFEVVGRWSHTMAVPE